MATYGVLLFLAGSAYFVLVRMLLRVHGQPTALADAIGGDIKGKLSSLIFAIAIPVALVAPGISLALDVAVVVMWLIPDRRMERAIRG